MIIISKINNRLDSSIRAYSKTTGHWLANCLTSLGNSRSHPVVSDTFYQFRKGQVMNVKIALNFCTLIIEQMKNSILIIIAAKVFSC